MSEGGQVYEYFRRGDVVVVSGAAGVGRTGFALSLVRDAVTAGERVLFVGLPSTLESLRPQRPRCDGLGTLSFLWTESLDEAVAAAYEFASGGGELVVIDDVERMTVGDGHTRTLPRLVTLARRVDLGRPTVVLTVCENRSVSPGSQAWVFGMAKFDATVHVGLNHGERYGLADVVLTRTLKGVSVS